MMGLFMFIVLNIFHTCVDILYILYVPLYSKSMRGVINGECSAVSIVSTLL